MSDMEKAISLLQQCLDERPYAAVRVSQIMSCIQEAVDLLKEQEPKLVRYTASTVRCPNCNKQITTKKCIHREIKYCWKCGQAVKWDE